MPQLRRPQYRYSALRPPMKRQSLLRKSLAHKGMLVIVSALIITVLLFAFFEQHHRKAAGNDASGTSAGQTADFNKQQYSVNDPNSIWVVVNKPRPLNPPNYAPADLVTPAVPLRLNGKDSEMQLRAPAANALKSLFDAATAQGLHLMLASGYRSYDLQVTVYNKEVSTNGQAAADKESARPGHSEHQTGLAADIEPTSRQCEVAACFADLPEGKWLAANAYKYGFILRYTADKVHTTGYEYEPWHIRYVGTDLAAEMHTTNIETLEEFFTVKGGESYN